MRRYNRVKAQLHNTCSHPTGTAVLAVPVPCSTTVLLLMMCVAAVLLLCMAGCAHVVESQPNSVSSILQHPVPSSMSTSEEVDWTSYVLTDAATCRTHVCIEARGEGRAYVVNGQLRTMGDVWVLGKGPTVVSIANPAIPDSVWMTTPELQPGLWRLEIAVTPTAPLQSYAQLERYHPLKGWVQDGYTVFVNQTGIMLPNRVPPPATTSRNK